MRRLTLRRRRDERGAVVVLMVAFVLGIVGMAALVIDVGAILDEKRQLQNGADAAALGLAQHIGQNCPLTPTCVPSSLLSAAQSLAAPNVRDGSTTVDPPAADYATKRVTVRTSTLGGGSGTILPYTFGQILSGVRGKTVQATAAASWAGLRRASVIPLTISRCEFDGATGNGTVFGVLGPVYFHTDAPRCAAGPSGIDIPGGFGWLRDENDTNNRDCNVTPTTGDSVRADSGLPGSPGACDMAVILDHDVLIPIYDNFTGSGGNARYQIYGFAQFHLDGYKFPTQNGGLFTACTNNACLFGQFIRFVAIGDFGGPNLGNRVALVS